jgi:spore coat protein CotH
VAVENFLAEMDGFVGFSGVNNFYLYRPAGSARVGVIPWDKDLTFGSVVMPPDYNLSGNALMSRVWADPGLRPHLP